MSIKNRKFNAGLAALGLCWSSAIAVAQGPEPAPTSAQAPSNAPTFAVLVLSNGREIQGEISEDKSGTNFLLHSKGGTIPLPKRNVERRFASVEELYRYKVSSLPEGDADVLMKLARWCLEKRMNAEAKVHLKAALEINPKDIAAERMLASLDASEDRGATGRDPAVQVTGATMVDSAPRELNASALPRPRGELGRQIDRPVIFDLPPAVAYKRTVDFARYVHPILQQACASCHNESYNGGFRLIPARLRREGSPEVVRANLDAALHAVNRDDPARSDLLAFAANPHGNDARPIFHGPNDPRYRTLLTWLGSLKATEAAPRTGTRPPAPPRSTSAGTAAEPFGADRFAGRTTTPPPARDPIPVAGMPNPQGKVEVIRMDATDPRVPPSTGFVAPYMQGGPKPVIGNSNTPPSPLPINAAGATAPMPALTQEGIATPGTPLPSLPPGLTMPPPDDVIPPTNRAKKKSALDRALLEKVLRSRQAAVPTPEP